MTPQELQTKIQKIVALSTALKNEYVNIKDTPVNYACIFSQNQEEYQELNQAAEQLGQIIKNTPTGPLYQIQPLRNHLRHPKTIKNPHP